MCANRVSCFIGSNRQATARKTVTIRDIDENLKTIHTGCGAWCVWRDATVN